MQSFDYFLTATWIFSLHVSCCETRPVTTAVHGDHWDLGSGTGSCHWSQDWSLFCLLRSCINQWEFLIDDKWPIKGQRWTNTSRPAQVPLINNHSHYNILIAFGNNLDTSLTTAHVINCKQVSVTHDSTHWITSLVGLYPLPTSNTHGFTKSKDK